MNQTCSARIRYEDLRSLGFVSITGSYATIGTAFDNPIRMLKVTNTTDVNILVSFNGINDKDIVAANSAYVYDYASNKSTQSGFAEQSAGERVYIKAESGLPTIGSVYITAIYVAQS